MTYAKGFFDLQLRFAHKVAALSGLPLAHALLEYTNLYAGGRGDLWLLRVLAVEW